MSVRPGLPWEGLAGVPSAWTSESGAELRRRREAACLTQTELAAALGVDATTERMWEAGRVRPPSALLGALALVFRCSVDVFAPEPCAA